jgi:hypothetical protein
MQPDPERSTLVDVVGLHPLAFGARMRRVRTHEDVDHLLERA